jgi:hypothetical protein
MDIEIEQKENSIENTSLADNQEVVPEKEEIKSDKKKFSEEPTPVTIEDINKRLDLSVNQDKSNLFQQEINAQENIKENVQNIVNKDFQNIENLLKMGFINFTQAQNLKQVVLKNAFDSVVQGEINNPKSQLVASREKKAVFSEFDEENSGFFTQREDILNYLKTGEFFLDKDELSKIAKLVENLEKNAIEKYLKIQEYEQKIQKGNEVAKEKLKVNAQSNSSAKNGGRIFTREQIGNLSGAEFKKYESVIMNQLKKGLIK